MAEAPNVEAEAEEPLNLSKLPEDTPGKVKKIPLHSTKSAKAVASIAGKSRRLVRKAVEAKAVVEPAVEKVVEAAPLAPVVEKAVEVVPAAKVVAPLVNIRQEMLEGENAVAAVRNLEHGLAAKGDIKSASEAEVKVIEANALPCAELFDPCTREPIEDGNIDILEKRVRDIKKLRLVDIAEKAKFPNMTRLDLLLFILNREELPNEGLLQYSQNGQLYESYWDIVFTLGLIDTFPVTKDFHMYNGKIETLTNIDGEGFVNNPLTYLSNRNVFASSSTGASDITFVYKKHRVDVDIDPCSSDPTTQVTASCSKGSSGPKATAEKKPLFYFCSSKYFSKDSTKGVDKFDIQNIYTAAKKLDQDYDRKIILLVKDKGAVEEKLRKAIRKYLSEEASYVYGMSDLFAALTTLYTFVHSKHPTKDKLTSAHIREILKLESPPDPILRLRLHQYLATYKICDAIKHFKERPANNKFLVGIVPRGGKTFIAGGIIDALNPKRVVVLLGAKSETLSQFKGDLFEKFQNFKEYECVDVVNTTDMAIDPSKKYIFIMSVELYKQVDSTRRLLQDLKGGANRADLFICDEAHLKQTTKKATNAVNKATKSAGKKVESEPTVVEEEEVSKEAEESQLKELDKQIQTDVPVVYMTGTYMKPLSAFNIPDDHVIIWDYQDIQQAKELSTNEEYFKENFGEFYDRALATCISYGQTHDTIEKQYQQFPELYLLTTQFTPDAKDAFLLQGTGGFPTISHLFEVKTDFNPEKVKPEQWHSGFTNPKGIARLLNYLAPSVQQLKTVDGVAIEPISSALKSVDMIAQRIGDRLGFFTSDFVAHSQLWFLPHMQKNPLYKRMCALAGAIFQSPWFRKYFHVIAVSSSIKWNIPGSKDNSISVNATDGSDSCGTFSWACPAGGVSLKQCLLDQEAVARKKGKGLIILAQNMLHLGISLPCVDIVVLLDTGEKVDERIQKMYRALTESTNKKGGYIIDMNYFRTVTAIMNYQITAEQTRKGKKKNDVFAGDIPRIFNKVLDIYSIDDDKHILRSEIVKETLPELEKLIATGKKTGDGIMLKDAGHALNANIEHVIEKDYRSSYDEFLGLLAKEEAKQKKVLREEGANVAAAAHSPEKRAEGDDEESDEESEYTKPIIFREDYTETERREAYIDIFKTTLKLGAFGTDAVDIKTLEDKLATDDELRQTLYDTLIKRKAIQGINVMTKNDIFLNKHKETLKKIKKYMKKIMEYKKSIKDFKKYLTNKKNIFNAFTEENKVKLIELVGQFLVTIQSLNNDELESINSNINNDEEPLNTAPILSELNDFFTEIEYDTLSEEERHEIEKEAAHSSKELEKNINFIIDTLIRPGLIKMISEDRNASYFKMKKSIEDDEKYPAHVEKVLEYIKEHLTPKSAERHKFGEVFTPMTLVNEMLDTLPAGTWNNKDLKWLDPANGMGNFPIGVFLRLFYGFRTKAGKYIGVTEEGEGDYNPGLTKVIPGEEARRKHIVKNMLYMVELNTKNIAISKTLFKKLAPGIEPNIIQMHRKEGFLADIDMKFPNGNVGKFDIIMGNPPFNKGAVRVAMVTNKTRKERKDLGIEDDTAESGFWFEFVKKALAKGVLKPNGFLLFIHPITWFKPDKAGAHDLMLSKQLLNIRIYTDSISKALFGGKGEITVAYYLLENRDSTKKTKIVNMNNGNEEVKLNKSSIIIKQGNSIFQKIQEKSKLFGNGDGLKHVTINECNDSGQYKLITILEDSGEIKYVKSSVAHPDQHTPKVIVGGVPKPIVLFDEKGEYGLFKKGQRHYFVGDDLDKINDYFKTKLSTFLLKYVKFEQKFIKPSYYPDVRSIDLGTITDKTLADHFGFTAEERKEIAQMPDPIHPKADKIVKITCAELKSKKAVTGDSGEEAPCPPDKERLPGTTKCIKKCIPPKIRSEKGRCVNPPGTKSKRSVKGGGHKTRRLNRKYN
jgi:hypothetical protein